MMPTTNTNQYQRILTAHERAMHRRQADKDRIGRLLDRKTNMPIP